MFGVSLARVVAFVEYSVTGMIQLAFFAQTHAKVTTATNPKPGRHPKREPSPGFFVLWGPYRQFFSFCGARIAIFFSFCGTQIANFFVLWGPDRQLFSFCGAQIAISFRFRGSGSPIETKTEKLKSTRKR